VAFVIFVVFTSLWFGSLRSSLRGVDLASIQKLQDYLRNAAARGHEVYAQPPFHLYLHETDDLRFFNYAIPDHPLDGLTAPQLDALRSTFAAHSRTLRFEFLHEYAPLLGAAMDALGVPSEGENPLLVCTPETWAPMAPPEGLRCLRLTPDSAERDLADYVETQSRGFGDVEWGATPEDIEDLRRQLTLGNGATLARLGDEAVAAGGYAAPLDGFAELVGVATLPEHRRRGIAGALTALLASDAFARGVRIALLTAADEDASRVYQRSGFRRVGTGLAYGDP
jgi:ribosomal protein S18 acetylase RimI-like enzyme